MTVETRDNSAVGDETKGSGAAPESKGESIEELKAKLEKLEKQNAELFKEKKSASTKLSQFEKEQQERERALLEEQGKHKELYQKEREEKLKLGEKLKSKVMDQTIKDALRKAGCSDENKLSKLMGFKTVSSYGDKVKFDDDFQADTTTLNDFVNGIKAEFDGLGFFSKEAPNSKDVNPTNPGERDISRMDKKEVSNTIKKLLQEKSK